MNSRFDKHLFATCLASAAMLIVVACSQSEFSGSSEKRVNKTPASSKGKPGAADGLPSVSGNGAPGERGLPGTSSISGNPDATPAPTAAPVNASGQDANGGTNVAEAASNGNMAASEAAAQATPKPPPPTLSAWEAALQQLPGVPVVRVGVGFNDNSFSKNDDQDYNDAAFCFEMAAKLDPATKHIWSYKDQVVNAAITSISGCTHRVHIKIFHPDGSVYDQQFPSNLNNVIQLAFKIRSRLEVSVITTDDDCELAFGKDIPMYNQDWFRVEGNACRNTGG